ncbi:hypothetical protein PoB_006988900 [Plakobranchus ocellatus]|uniref:Uncharacterized protein n=1 Tax=Plakobranchus ocellatus TaxID=259542 RepID=A0AAV4DGL0_9GAST|nr:hypothetical protein PoB_006988900 [Plakobranchus ocellatus]
MVLDSEEENRVQEQCTKMLNPRQKASLMMVPAVAGTVNRKSASVLKGVFCQGFEFHHHCSGLIEGLQTSDHPDDENANQARIILSAS